jgi:hypothetical protein
MYVFFFGGGGGGGKTHWCVDAHIGLSRFGDA